MRTTLTLDADNAEGLREFAHRSRLSFKRVVNEALRRGLRAGLVVQAEPPFVVEARPMGLKAGRDPLHLSQLEAELEIQAFEKKTKRLRKIGR
ncbi:MAG: DUF2191 domain-containing protein [Terrimicrobiaceae bacterium]